jgi:beta-lactamase class A
MAKRHDIIGAILIVVGISAQDMKSLRSSIEKVLHAAQGTFAVAFEDLTTGKKLFINEKEEFHAASMMKVPVMIEVYRQVALGRFALDDSVVVKNEFRSIADGSSYSLSPQDDSDETMYDLIGNKTTLRQLLWQMITVSSNLATNILIDHVGAENVTATMRSLGAQKTRVLRGVEDSKAYERGLNNSVTAYDMLLIFKAIAEERAVDTEASKEMMSILLGQQFRDKIPSLLPAGARVAHKTGSITGVEHDGGIVFLPDGRKYILVVLSKGLDSADTGKRVIAEISRLIYDVVMRGG